jgi:sulfur-carrier protein
VSGETASELLGQCGQIVVVDQDHPLAKGDATPGTVVSEMASAKVGDAFEVLAVMFLDHVDHSAVGHHQHLCPGMGVGQPVQGGGHALVERVGGLEPWRTTALVEPPRPVAFDVVSGQALPFSGVAFAQVAFHHDRAHPEFGGDDGGRLHGALQVRRNHQVHGSDEPGRNPGLHPTEIGQRRILLALPSAEGVPFRLAMTNQEHAGHACDATGPRAWSGPGQGQRRHDGYSFDVATLRMFAAAREASGLGNDDIGGTTVAAVLDEARARYGEPFTSVLSTCRIWVNGEPAEMSVEVGNDDEVAVLPPVSGG